MIKLNKIAASSGSGPERTTLSGGSSSSDTGTTTATPGTYTIASGDTFAKVASKLGVTLQALLDANPGTDPRRLAIGQVIKIPAN